jgi:hypothetical protein
MTDAITVNELPKVNGMGRSQPQPYEIVVAPVNWARMPELPFLHKQDGLTLEDGTTYWIESARQVPVKTNGDIQWNWIYRVTRDTSGEPNPWDAELGVSDFGR